ncbi:hypothetical protein FOS14_01550 [Skermania sp. ID1734]|uniref:hypothetical protein n=1 Tax=Skermania sp. ID1734 TaxID=2597516 RepID=UPI001180CADE|nr:hypothetical protein [Skermania sp. ID1734]TSE02094.1 hypothetical protein FOS14_01550 [Skermania sp. ID1734]
MTYADIIEHIAAEHRQACARIQAEATAAARSMTKTGAAADRRRAPKAQQTEDPDEICYRPKSWLT